VIEPDAPRNHRDGLLARRLADAFGRDGWSVECHRLGDGRWAARVACPSTGIVVDAPGTSRVSAISAAHVEAVRKLTPGVRL
jgi:hypothetical protein